MACGGSPLHFTEYAVHLLLRLYWDAGGGSSVIAGAAPALTHAVVAVPPVHAASAVGDLKWCSYASPVVVSSGSAPTRCMRQDLANCYLPNG
jgi:hypothetical protein